MLTTEEGTSARWRDLLELGFYVVGWGLGNIWSAQFYLLFVCVVQMLPVAVMGWTTRQAQSPWSVIGGSAPDVETVMRVLWLCLPRSGPQASFGISLVDSRPLEILHTFFQ